jgi:hypothetical protein
MNYLFTNPLANQEMCAYLFYLALTGQSTRRLSSLGHARIAYVPLYAILRCRRYVGAGYFDRYALNHAR